MTAEIVIIIGYILLVVGIATGFYGQLRLMALTYNNSLWWFFGCWILPLFYLPFVLSNFKVARKPFALALIGLIVAGLGEWMSGITQRI